MRSLLNWSAAALLAAWPWTVALGSGPECLITWRGILDEKLKPSVDQTDRIPATLNVAFGITFRFRNVLDASPIRYKEVWKIPEPGIIGPNTGKVDLGSTKDRTLIPTFQSTTTQILWAPWQLVTGTWKVEIWVDDQLSCAQAFEVFKP